MGGIDGKTRKALPAQVDVAHLISAGVLASVCPRALIDEVLAETGKAASVSGCCRRRRWCTT